MLGILCAQYSRSIFAELMASFLYVFIVCGAAAGAGVGATVSSVLLATALASGFVVTTLTQCFSHVSGKRNVPYCTNQLIIQDSRRKKKPYSNNRVAIQLAAGFRTTGDETTQYIYIVTFIALFYSGGETTSSRKENFVCVFYVFHILICIRSSEDVSRNGFTFIL